ncbi:MAG: isoprenylcysteine carboxylmethyltransferase family protein [Planctomycetota bacterium]
MTLLEEHMRTQGDVLFRTRSHWPLGLFAAGLAVKVQHEGSLTGAHETPVAEVLEGAALTVALAGLALRVFAVGCSPADTSGRNTKAGQVAAVLNTTGVYSLTRNPLYLGNFLVWGGVVLSVGSLWFLGLFVLVFGILYERVVLAEETFLRDRFGDRYTRWAATTPVFLPRHLRYVRAALPFSWRKALKKEKNGIAGLFLALCALDLAGDWAEGQLSLEAERGLIGVTLVAGVLYLVLRALKRRTSLLDETGR